MREYDTKVEFAITRMWWDIHAERYAVATIL